MRLESNFWVCLYTIGGLKSSPGETGEAIFVEKVPIGLIKLFFRPTVADFSIVGIDKFRC